MVEITPALLIAAFETVESLLSWLKGVTADNAVPLTEDEKAAVRARRKLAEDRYKEILKEIEGKGRTK